jgi:ParB/RepB/Spo0J family partition protein
MKSLKKNVRYIEIKNILFDTRNPRGETEEQIENDPEFRKLINSIKQHGILEPLIIKKENSDIGLFRLIDGERRLRAAIKVSQGDSEYKVPALIARDDIDARILAYQVHMLRKNWSKAAETKSIKAIIADIREKNPRIKDSELTKRIKEITAHRDHEISDLLKLIKYDDDIIDKAISKELSMSYLVQIESSFINPLKRSFPLVAEKYGEEKIRNILIKKALDGLLGNTRFLMDYFRNVFSDEDNKDKARILIENFLENDKKSIEDAYSEYLRLGQSKDIRPKHQKKIKAIRKQKTKRKEKIDIFHYKKIRVTKQQQTTIEDIRKKIESIAKKLTDEEYEYIKEAIYCLERNCFKAATLMIWASGVSKVLKYVSKDLSDFNRTTNNMMRTPRSVYKYFAKNFYKNAPDIESVRENANDRQLLSYLFYKGIISRTEFNKLHANYRTRCDCAHPTDIRLKVNEVLSIFENIYDLVLNNKKLR